MKSFLSLAILCIPIACMHAQSGDSKTYIKVFGNYALPTSASYRPSGYTSSVINQDYSIETVKKGLGMGVRAGAGIGMVLNDFINIGLDVEDYFGKPIKSSFLYYYDNQAGLVTISNTINDYRANMLFISPNITFKAMAQTNFFIYNRLAIKVGAMAKVTEKSDNKYNERFVEDINVNPNPTDHITSSRQDFEYKGGVPYGFSAAIGVQVKLTDQLRFFAEAEFTQLTYNPKKKVMTKWVNNAGEDVDLGAIDKIQVETEYKKEYRVLSGQTDVNAPNPQPLLRMPFSSIGLGVGLIFRI